MDFFYDASGYPFAVKYNGDLCYYITNLQGDVMSIVDAQGEVVAEYEYDPYGNIVSQSGPLAEANPLRYRGYVYDTESGLYYLQSRYYDPEMGRFINADSYASTGQGVLGNNMFAYCGNNAPIFADPHGYAPQDIFPVEISGDARNTQADSFLNILLKTTGMINGQAIFPYAENRMGLGTYAKNGCGIIAIYNAMQLLGFQESLGLIEGDIQYAGGFLFAGLLGIEPWAIKNYFDAHGISCRGYTSFQTLSQDVQEGSIVIFLVLNNASTILNGAHYMAAQYIGGEYVVYNMYNSWPEPVRIDSLEQPYGNSGFVCGYIVGG